MSTGRGTASTATTCSRRAKRTWFTPRAGEGQKARLPWRTTRAGPRNPWLTQKKTCAYSDRRRARCRRVADPWPGVRERYTPRSWSLSWVPAQSSPASRAEPDVSSVRRLSEQAPDAFRDRVAELAVIFRVQVDAVHVAGGDDLPGVEERATALLGEAPVVFGEAPGLLRGAFEHLRHVGQLSGGGRRDEQDRRRSAVGAARAI